MSTKPSREDKVAVAAVTQINHHKSKEEESPTRLPLNTMSVSITIYWLLPMLCIAIMSRFAVDTGPAFRPQTSRPISINMGPQGGATTTRSSTSTSSRTSTVSPTPRRDTAQRDTKDKGDTSTSLFLANKPYSYQEVVKAIGRRRLDWETTSTEPTVRPSQNERVDERSSTGGTRKEPPSDVVPPPVNKSPPPSRGLATDPARLRLWDQIDQFRKDYEADKTNMLNAIMFAESLRFYDVRYHDGGTMQQEAIETYQIAIELALNRRAAKIEAGEETSRSLNGVVDLNEEITLDFSAKSMDGIMCALYTALGKVYFMANMFENAVLQYTQCIDLAPTYLDAVASRASAGIILGKYQEAATDFSYVIENDLKRRFLDAFTGLARVLQTKEQVSPLGWDSMIEQMQTIIMQLESQVGHLQQSQEVRALIASSLARLYHVLFLYHDSKTKDKNAAWDSLTKAYEYKMSVLPPWNSEMERQKIQATTQIFHKGFWPAIGSKTNVPIFIIGFVRSGSTLLERILDAHPDIAGTGENSVFNGNLDEIRNNIVKASTLGDPQALHDEVERSAAGVVTEIRRRWSMVASAEGRTNSTADNREPKRFVDKMLTNYYNVGFIQMLFPNALILHIAREPMDTVFSAYKHEFPSGPLDYTSAFESLADMYQGYRKLMDHWDRALPGRIVHIKYEDLVRDTAVLTKAIIGATGLDWHDEILDFHKKKQAVNTLSTTQVRKGIYTDSLQAWRKYETQLQPLVTMIGEYMEYPLKTTVPGYSPPSSSSSFPPPHPPNSMDEEAKET